MNNQGFTLIELVAIIVVISAIFLVSFPALSNMSKKDSEKQYDDMIKDLCLAGKTYIYSHDEYYKELLVDTGNSIEIKIDDLVAYGNVSEDIINIKTNKPVINDSLTYVVLEDKSLGCNYNESNVE